MPTYEIYRCGNEYGKPAGLPGRGEFGIEIMVALAYQVDVVGVSIDKACRLLNFFEQLKLRKSQADALRNALQRQCGRVPGLQQFSEMLGSPDSQGDQADAGRPVLQSFGKQLTEFRLQSVIDEVARWTAVGQSCFDAMRETLSRNLSAPLPDRKGILDQIILNADT
ncbi:MAG: hypothetical protein R3C59_16100 [Planctomycetaceae bacterium]